ncbi:MucB/RseB C-terminal domain-containing protein [Piscinibacter sakaiensis]|uniref:MucB/RseB C-terminal domain-containing protein n=1 Tax=Piscinibacter sakaiensis TaxID=1547922 RepID=UPI003AAFEF0D
MRHRLLIARASVCAWSFALALGSAVAADAAAAETKGAARPAALSTAQAQQWLQRIQQAPSKRNFQGTFVVSAGGSLSSARMTHYQVGNSQYELIESLNGQARLVFRHDDVIQTNWPQHRVALIEQREKLGSFPALLEAGDPRVVEFYELRVLGEDRVAGRLADVLQLTPRDALRFSKRLWVDKESGLLLREDVLGANSQVLESSAFSDVAVGVRPQPEAVLAGMKKLDGYRVVRPTLTTAELEAEGWVQREMVPGFRRVSCIKRPLFSAGEVDAQTMSPQVLQTIYTDGLTFVSVFIEAFDEARHSRPVLTSIGATHTLMVRQGDWWFTVVGDAPPAALRAFAKAVERKR